MARSRRFLLGAILLPLLQGCALDLVEPELFAARFFTTLVRRPDEDGGRFFLDAALDPGIARSGRRGVPDPALGLGESTRFPTKVLGGDPPSEFEWRNLTDLVASPSGNLGVLPPTVTGLPQPSVLELPAMIAVTPQGPILLEEGEDLILHLEPSTRTPIFLRWSLALANTSAGVPFLLSLEGVGSWPAEIRIPASHLTGATFPLVATIRVIAEFEPAAPTAGYDILGRIDFVMEKRVERAPQ